jgi:hypothetical protein
MRTTLKQLLGIPILACTFCAGVLVGSLAQRPADAQMGGIGSKALEGAGAQGGALGAAAKLGTSITDMQEHVSGLQKNLETLKTIQAALGG